MRILKDVPKYSRIKKENPALKALIFDMDGTFFDSEPLHAIAHKKLIHFFGNGTNLSDEEIKDRYQGLTDQSVYQELMKDKLINFNTDIELFLEKKDLLIRSEIPSLSLEKIFNPEILQLILAAKEDSIKVALCTASEKSLTHLILKTFNFYSIFDLIKTNGDFTNGKPHPEPYIETTKELNLDLSEVVIFEDSVAGVASAKASTAPMYKVEWYNP